jgi:protein TonB
MTESRTALCGALLLACAAAWAQPAPQPSAAASAAERAQKESDRTMYWIRVLADKPAPVRAAAPPKPVVAAAPPPVRATAEVREKVKVASASPSLATNTVGLSPATEPSGARVPELGSASFGYLPDPTTLRGAVPDNLPAAEPLPMPDLAPAPVEEPDPGLVQIKSVAPDFPTAVVRRVHKGNVEVKFEVDAGGTVIDATVVGSSHARLNDAAVEAIRQWRFKPGPKAHTALVNLVFDIDNEK